MKNLVLGKRILALGAMLMVGYASADPIIFDRGLPTANLNAADASRSNVAWGDVDPYLIGDTFNISGTNNYVIDDFTVWYVSSSINASTTDFSLYIGSVLNQPLNLRSSTSTTSLVTYQGGQTYQGSGGGPIAITQLTFTNLGLTVANNTDYYFTVAALDNNSNDDLITPLFLHSSNAPLSGSPQQGADGSFSGFLYNNGAVTWNYDWDSAPPLGGDGGWDKSSDVNVQITGAVVPVPAAAGLGFLGMGLVGFLRRRKNTAA